MRQFARLILACVVAGVLGVGSAGAQSCYTLQAQLDQLLSQGRGGSGDRSRYEQAYRKQAVALDRTEQQARRYGCLGFGFFLFKRDGGAACDQLMPRMRQMQDNLARLDRLRRQSSGTDIAYRIRELRGMLRARNCDGSGGGGGFFRRLLPQATWDDDPFAPPRYDTPSHDTPRGTYRTLCVRTCDGYYFPISFSTVTDQFSADQQTCQAMCPGAESELYYYPNPGGEPESMVSVTGTQYASLPTAFQYRRHVDASCTCRPQGGYATAIPMSTAPGGAIAKPGALPPRPRPAPGEDPETLANRAGYLLPQTSSDAARIASAGRQPVRVVGPVYWGAPQENSVVITPVPN